MLRKSLAVVGAAVLLAGCSTTVPGSPVADPSGVPKPDTGSYPTTPRTIAPASEKMATALEGFRMAEIIPLAPDVEPKLRYGKSPGVGKLTTATVKSIFGEGLQTVVGDHEVAAYTSATEKVPGSDPLGRSNDLIMGLFRFKDDGAARAAAANPAFMTGEKDFDGKVVPKTQIAVPGYADAKAFTKTTTFSDGSKWVSTVGVLASGRYLLAGWTSGPVEQVQKFFDLQVKSLQGFVPTPVEKFGTLPRDPDGLLRYTLPEQSRTIYEATWNTRTAAAWSTDITAAQQYFADAGVDYVSNAANTIYRARDAVGADLMRDRLAAETKKFHEGTTESTVTGVPGGRCVTYPTYKGSKDTRTYCVASSGRFTAEVTDSQDARAKQAISASYLILQQAK